MDFPLYRSRRMRGSSAIRSLAKETIVNVSDLQLPLFAVPGRGVEKEISSMPGVYHYSVDRIIDGAKRAWDLGIKSVLLFGIPERKDSIASRAYDDDAPLQRAIREVKANVPDLLVMSDVCLCAFMDHGHCGVLKDGGVDNDSSLDLLAKTALSHARAGVDFVAPSDMMDGRVGAIRSALDEAAFQNVGIMSYAVKYSSAFYGPFREAADSAPSMGDRSTYQMDPANKREARREASLDESEGADVLMVKPALSYLDVIASLRELSDLPLAAYNVSGEYSMIKAAAEKGLLDEERVMIEVLTSMKRAGADVIITYFAMDAARYLRQMKG